MKKPRPAATGLSRRTIFQRPSTHRAVNLAAGLHDNPETEGQDMVDHSGAGLSACDCQAQFTSVATAPAAKSRLGLAASLGARLSD